MRAEALQRRISSTGGNALPYIPPMRDILRLLSLSLLTALPIACGDDEEPTRPNDGTVKAWESCMWDGQVTPALCEIDLSCSSHGVCSPVCETIVDCPDFEGFDVECSENDAAKICRPRCNTANECPQTGGAELKCHQFYCIGDS